MLFCIILLFMSLGLINDLRHDFVTHPAHEIVAMTKESRPSKPSKRWTAVSQRLRRDSRLFARLLRRANR